MASEGITNPVDDIELKTVGGTAPSGLNEAEVKSVKEELVQEMVDKLLGQDRELLDELLQPQIITAPYDPRFPSTNQARHCYIRFNEFHKCLVERGEDDERCKFYKRCYESLCPSEWVEEWQEMRDNGTWPGKY